MEDDGFLGRRVDPDAICAAWDLYFRGPRASLPILDLVPGLRRLRELLPPQGELPLEVRELRTASLQQLIVRRVLDAALEKAHIYIALGALAGLSALFVHVLAEPHLDLEIVPGAILWAAFTLASLWETHRVFRISQGRPSAEARISDD